YSLISESSYSCAAKTCSGVIVRPSANAPAEAFLSGTHSPGKGIVIVSGLYHTTLFLSSISLFLLRDQFTSMCSAPKRCYTTDEDLHKLDRTLPCERVSTYMLSFRALPQEVKQQKDK